MSGYDIKHVLSSRGRLGGEPSFSSLYPALNALAKDGLATMELETRQNKPARKIYNLGKCQVGDEVKVHVLKLDHDRIGGSAPGGPAYGCATGR